MGIIVLSFAIGILALGWFAYVLFRVKTYPVTPQEAGIDLPATATDVHSVGCTGGDLQFYVSAKVTYKEFGAIVEALNMKIMDAEQREFNSFAFIVDPAYQISDWWKASYSTNDESYFGERPDFPHETDASMMYMKYKDGVLYFHNAVQ